MALIPIFLRSKTFAGAGGQGGGNSYALTASPQNTSGKPGSTQQITVTESPSSMALTAAPQGSSGKPGSTQQMVVTG